MGPQEANCFVSGDGYAPERHNRREIRPRIALLIDAAMHKGVLIASTLFLQTLMIYETIANQRQGILLGKLIDFEQFRGRETICIRGCEAKVE